MRLKGWLILPLLSMLLILIMPMMSGELLTREEVDSLIPPDQYFKGSDVQELVWDLIQTANKEIGITANEAVAEATTPLMIKIAGLKAEIEAGRQSSFNRNVLCVGAGLVIGSGVVLLLLQILPGGR
jgi:hypothetical protein